MDYKEQIISKVNRSRKGSIFLPDTFLPIDTRYASNVLSDLTKDGKLVRIAFGIYLKPKKSKFGPVMPSLHDIAHTIAKRDAAEILPTGATAENYLGFSTQVPMNVIYLTSGTPRIIKIGGRTLTLKHSVPSTFAYKSKMLPIIVLALKSIGKNNVTEDMQSTLVGILREHPEDETWQEDMLHVPQWIRKLIINAKNKIKGLKV